MSAVGTFFRHCPACGKRFELRLVAKKEAVTESSESEARKTQVVPRPIIGMRADTPTMVGLPVTISNGAPELDETEEFDLTYKCMHCSHQWTEERLVYRKGKVKGAYTGD